MNINEIKELITAIDKSSINKFEIETEMLKMTIEKSSKDNTKAVIKNNDINYISNNEEDIEYIEEKEEINENLYTVNAPIMGTFYASSSPDTMPYVNVGDKIKKGDTLCILEAMKLMNEIQSDVDGEIIEILAKNEDLVEYAQPIFKIRQY